MKLDIKKYRLKKIEHYLKNNKLIVITNKGNVKRNDTTILTNFFVNNNLLRKKLKDSIYNNLTFLITGFVNLSTIKYNLNLDLEKHFIKNLNSKNNNIVIALKLNNKIYSSPQLNKLKSLNYSKNMVFLHKTLKNCISFPSKKLISK